jgi:hypothetical protein
VNSATRFSIRLYRLVARLFPEEFRALHARPLLETSEDLIEAVAARHGILGLAPMMLRILVDLVLRVVAEHSRDLVHDTRHALRVLQASPGFTLAATISIALGLSVAIGVFSQMESIVLARLKGIDRPESLVTAYGVTRCSISWRSRVTCMSACSTGAGRRSGERCRRRSTPGRRSRSRSSTTSSR